MLIKLKVLFSCVSGGSLNDVCFIDAVSTTVYLFDLGTFFVRYVADRLEFFTNQFSISRSFDCQRRFFCSGSA